MPILPNFFVPPGADIWEEVADLLETTEPGQFRGSSIHDAVQEILEGLNLGNTGAGVTPLGADIWEGSLRFWKQRARPSARVVHSRRSSRDLGFKPG